MELLFNQLRPMTIHKYASQPRTVYYRYVNPVPYYFRGSWYGFNRGYGFEPYYGAGYNYFYPYPSVYRNY